MRARDSIIDSLKFILICLVILGHAIEPSRYSTSYIGWIYSPIYLFHMPLFALLSGYFSKLGTMEKILQSSVKIFETYIVMCIVIILINHSFNEFFHPAYANWYLLSLLFWRLSIFAVEKHKMGGRNLLFISILAALFSFFVPTEKSQMFLSFGRTLQFAPFFVCGYLLTNEDINRLRNLGQKRILSVFSIILCMVAGLCSCRGLHLLEFHRASLMSIVSESMMSISSIIGLKVYVELSAIVLSLWLLSIRFSCTYLAKYGKDTLLFFMLQLVLVQLGARFLPEGIMYELISVFACILLGCFLSYSGFSKWITNPISSIIRVLYGIK